MEFLLGYLVSVGAAFFMALRSMQSMLHGRVVSLDIRNSDVATCVGLALIPGFGLLVALAMWLGSGCPVRKPGKHTWGNQPSRWFN